MICEKIRPLRRRRSAPMLRQRPARRGVRGHRTDPELPAEDQERSADGVHLARDPQHDLLSAADRMPVAEPASRPGQMVGRLPLVSDLEQGRHLASHPRRTAPGRAPARWTPNPCNQPKAANRSASTNSNTAADANATWSWTPSDSLAPERLPPPPSATGPPAATS